MRDGRLAADRLAARDLSAAHIAPLALACFLLTLTASVADDAKSSAISVSAPVVDAELFSDATLSLDHKTAALATLGQVTIWDVPSGGSLLRALSAGPVIAKGAVALSADGSLAVTYTSDNKIGVWDTNTGALLETYPANGIDARSETIEGVNELSISPDKRFIVRIGTYGANGYLGLFDRTSGKQVIDWNVPGAPLTDALWSSGELTTYGRQGVLTVSLATFKADIYLKGDWFTKQGVSISGVDPDGRHGEVVRLGTKGGLTTLAFSKVDFSSLRLTPDGQVTLSSDLQDELTKNKSSIDRVFRWNDKLIYGDTPPDYWDDRHLAIAKIVGTTAVRLAPTIVSDRGQIFARAELGGAIAPPFNGGFDQTDPVPQLIDLSSGEVHAFTAPRRAAHVGAVDENLVQESAGLVDVTTGKTVAQCDSGDVIAIGGKFYTSSAGDCGASPAPVQKVVISTPDGIHDDVPELGFVSTTNENFDPNSNLVFFTRTDDAIPPNSYLVPGKTTYVTVPGVDKAVALETQSVFSDRFVGAAGRLVRYNDMDELSVFDARSGRLLFSPGGCNRDALAKALSTQTQNLDQAIIAFAATRFTKSVDGRDVAVDITKLDDDQLLEIGCDAAGLDAMPEGVPLDAAAISPDGQLVAAADSGALRVWRIDDGTLQLEVKLKDDGVYGIHSLAFDREGQRVYSLSGAREVRIFDLATKAQTASFAVDAASLATIDSNDKDQVVVANGGTASGLVHIYDPKDGKNLIAYASTGSGYVVMTRDGFFDAKGDGASFLQVTDAHTIVGLDRLQQVLFRPDLVQALLDGDPEGLYADATKNTNLADVLSSGFAPAVQIVGLTQDSDNPHKGDLQLSLTPSTGGLGKIVVLDDTQTVGVLDAPTSYTPGQVVTVTGQVPLHSGANNLVVTAYNKQNIVASTPVSRPLNAVMKEEAPNLYILAVGIDDYLNTRLQLKYSTADARALSDDLSAAGQKLFNQVVVKRLLDKDATRDGISAAFDQLATQMKPEDVFVLYVAGHGITENGSYYFLPVDFESGGEAVSSEASLDDALASEAVDENRIQRWLAKIPARKSIVLLDTCESGSVAHLSFGARGLEEQVAIEKLNRATGLSILSASSDTEPALEGYKGHGVFTYALMEALANGDVNGDGVVDVGEMFQYVDDHVPDISQQAFGIRQVPQIALQGTVFPVASPTVSPALSEAGQFVPTRPTHVTTAAVQVYSDTALSKPSGEGLQPGVLVTVTGVTGEASQIAQNGQILGYVASSALIKLQ